MFNIPPFACGTWDLHPDVGLNFQLNRLVTMGGGRLVDVQHAAASIVDLRTWVDAFRVQAEHAHAEGRHLNAAAYWRAVEFYLPEHAAAKATAYKTQAALFETHVLRPAEARGHLTRHAVHYDGPGGRGVLPTWVLHPAGGPGAHARGTVVVHGGFDSYAEELFLPLTRFADAGFRTVLFEGPGQGAARRLHDVVFTPDWHHPVAAVLDQLGLEDVTLIGISLGGGLATRAAAFEPRVRRVIAYDVCWDFFDVVLRQLPAITRPIVRALLAGGRAGHAILNSVLRARMAKDPMVRWAVEHGSYVFGVASPAAYFQGMRGFSTGAISQAVTQDYLLLAGAEDHYMPLSHVHAQAAALKAVRSLAVRVYTAAEHGQAHCQVGNVDLAIQEMCAWIDGRAAHTIDLEGTPDA